MNATEISIQSWKDPDFRHGLSKEASAATAFHPSGALELTDAELMGVDGAFLSPVSVITVVVTIVSLVVSEVRGCFYAG